MTSYVTNDSGQRQTFSTGMQRDLGDKELRPDLIWPPMLARYEAEKDANLTRPARPIEDLFNDAYSTFFAWFYGKSFDGDTAGRTLALIADVEFAKAELGLRPATPLIVRWAELMGRGAIKYGERNWEKARTQEELNRFRASASRHFLQWFYGMNPEEDHAAAVCFNIAGAEYVAERMAEAADTETTPAALKLEIGARVYIVGGPSADDDEIGREGTIVGHEPDGWRPWVVDVDGISDEEEGRERVFYASALIVRAPASAAA